MSKVVVLALVGLTALMGCGENEPDYTVTPASAVGPVIGFMGVLRSDDSLLDDSGADAAGRSIYVSTTGGSGFRIVIDTKPGLSGAAVGISAFNHDPQGPHTRPDLQIQVTRDLGKGSAAVCDKTPGSAGGIPGIDPPDFAETQAISDALNDFGCRFDNGAGSPEGVTASDACPLFFGSDHHFVDPDATIEFCGFVPLSLIFPTGDTLVTARVRDVSGAVGPSRQMVIRVPPHP